MIKSKSFTFLSGSFFVKFVKTIAMFWPIRFFINETYYIALAIFFFGNRSRDDWYVSPMLYVLVKPRANSVRKSNLFEFSVIFSFPKPNSWSAIHTSHTARGPQSYLV
jgi:hypothetical protein